MATSTIHFKQSDSGSLNEGFNIGISYNWISGKGFGVGILYSGSFASAERDELTRTAQIHYLAPEAVFRQRAGKRWLFRESIGIGYGQYIRKYGATAGKKSGVGTHVAINIEYMLTKHIGLGANFGYEWIITQVPDVGDGFELPLFGLSSTHIGGGLRFYF